MTISTGARRQMDALHTAQPEAGPWLALLTAVLEECANPAWEAVAGATRLQPIRSTGTPLLAGAEIPLDRQLADHWLRRLLSQAAAAGPEAASLRAAADDATLDARLLLETAINADADRLAASAAGLAVSLDALAVAAGLAAMPLLQALRRRFGAAVDPAWSEGICPICGDWPLLAEQRGLERARRLRCGRCGGDWAQPGIRCPYCDATGHAARSALVSEQDGESRKVEVCGQCHGYLKSVSTLRPWAGDEVPLADMATVDLDLVALERDFERPAPRVLEPGVRVIG
jgi:FdhE protein